MTKAAMLQNASRWGQALFHAKGYVGSWALLAALSVSCLKADDRPTPGSVYVSVASSSGTQNGFTTDDGWAIHFDRFVAAVGDLSLSGFNDVDASGGASGKANCTEYSSDDYDRLFDFTKVSSPQKMAIDYALGTCALEIRLRPPSDTSILETGLTVKDLDAMRISANDAHVMDMQRVALRAQGSATRSGVSKRFDWSFRQGARVTRCSTGTPSSDQPTVTTLKANDAITVATVVSGEELFRSTPSDGTALVFDLIASADTDGDGTITIDELTKAPIDPVNLSLGTGEPSPDDPNPPAPPVSEADLLYDWLLPRVLHTATGVSCGTRSH